MSLDVSVLLGPVVAVLGAVLLEQCLLRPQPSWQRPVACWLLHVGVFTGLFAAGFAVSSRPWFAVAHALGWWLFILVVSRVKLAALREPFVFQDFEYFTDLLRHPRLYLPFFGYLNAALGVAGAGLLIWGGLSLEPPVSAIGPGLLACVLLACVLLACGCLLAARLQPSFDAGADVTRFGLVGAMCCYARAERQDLALLENLPERFAAIGLGDVPLPHRVVVQSESFFDARRAWPDIAPNVYAWLDEARRESWQFGPLEVPAWGANTVRSEFAFLSGLREESLGVHRFNPYRCLRKMKTLASALRAAGYRTVCVHPYAAAFYRRDVVFPAFGFDEFIDVRAFGAADYSGPYVGDLAVAERVLALLESSAEPLFVFVITMENHGPLHLETIDAAERRELLGAAEPAAGDELAIYLRHVCNAGRMWQRLRHGVQSQGRGGELCWYGDHVPILPRDYAQANFSDARSDYFMWSSASESEAPREQSMALSDLAEAWLSKRGRDAG